MICLDLTRRLTRLTSNQEEEGEEEEEERKKMRKKKKKAVATRGHRGKQWFVREDVESGFRHFMVTARHLRRDVLQAAGFMTLEFW